MSKRLERKKEKLLVVCGPTATGKTDLALKLAKKFNGEIISADSRQVYRGMDIGTGKDLPQSAKLKVKSEKFKLKFKSFGILKPYRFNTVPVWLLDVVEPSEKFSVADYCELAREVIADIWQRGKLPVMVGGTGFYIKAVVDGVESLGVEPDWELRRILGDWDTRRLEEELKRLDPKRWEGMNESDRKNPRRLIRAIEIVIHSKKQAPHPKPHALSPFFIGLTAPYKFLYQKIDARVNTRIEQGMIGEVKNLLSQGVSHQRMQEFGLEYRCIDDYLQNKTDKMEMIKKLKYQIHAFARRQMTWFRKDPRIHWFDISLKGWDNEVEKLVSSWYTGRQDAKKN